LRKKRRRGSAGYFLIGCWESNPTPLSNLLAMFGIFAIPSGLTYTLGSMPWRKSEGKKW
jgi:K+-transporting ATPase A subunit